MKSKKILYYSWGEITYFDTILSLEKSGHHVVVMRDKFESYDFDEKFMASVRDIVQKEKIDVIFSYGYLPDLSRVALELGRKYISWCFDSPHIILESVTLNNPCNYVFLFDYALCEQYKEQGITTVHYLPMACNVERVQNTIRKAGAKKEYQHEVTFLGTLYNDQYNFFEQIEYLPPYVAGYVSAVMEAQLPVFGMDMVRYLMRDDICEKILAVVKVGLGENYRDCKKDIIIHMIQKQITVNERKRLLTVLGEKFQVDHFASKGNKDIPVHYLGYADYVKQMPLIFSTSKINLNITLRSIQTGMPLRIIDILGAGGFCITNYQAELMQYFENDKSIVWYESYEELFEKIAFYLKNDRKREEIASLGFEIVKESFTYERAFERIWQIVERG